MTSERQKVEKLFDELCKQRLRPFPQPGKKLEAPLEQGVYIIRKGKDILHVGRNLGAENGIRQRLKDHLHGKSSFAKKYLNGDGAVLRKKGHTYQYLVVENKRQRGLLEAYATGMLCPKHLGLGK